MEKRSFHIKELSIHKIAGFPRGLPPYKDFSPQINIIAGPNASGKSTTAKAIQKVIWRNQTEGLQIDGNVNIADQPWSIRIDSNRVNVQRKGKEDELSGLPVVEEQGRYMLALHELVSVREENLVQHIINESIGGYDLDEATQKLGYSQNIKPRNCREFQTYDEANGVVTNQKTKQEDLKDKQKRLTGLYKKKENAEEANKLKEFYSKVIDYLDAKLSFKQKKEQFDGFPEVLEKVTGEEYERLNKLEIDIRKARGAIDDAESKIDENQEILGQLDIPNDGISDQILVELEERVERLEDWEEEISEIERNKKQFETLQQETLKSIGENPDTSTWDGLELEEIGELEKFLQTAHDTASERRFYEKEISELEKGKKDLEYDQTTLQKGIDALTNWLHEPRISSGTPKWIIPSVLIVAILATFISLLRWEAAFVGLIIIFALAVYGFIKSKQSTDSHNLKIREKDYKKTGLTPPENWDSESVRQRLETLIQNLQDAEWQERIQREIDNRNAQLESLQKRIKEVEKTGKTLRDKLSSLPELPFEDPQHYDSLYWFIIQAQKWQSAHEEAESLEESLKVNQEKYTSELEKFNNLCKKYNSETAEDSAQAKAIFKNLDKQEENRQKAVKEIETQKSIIEEKNETIKEVGNDLKGIYRKLDVEFGQKEEVRDLLNQLEEFKKVKQEYNAANVLFTDKKIALENHSKFEEEQSKIVTLTLDQARDELEKYEEVSEGLEEINKTITEIERDIEIVEGGNSLENALKNRDEALLNLKNLYDENLSSIAGQLLVNQLKKELREQNRPRVFKKANKLFNQITKGRYKVDIDEKDKPEFIAYDTIEKEGKTLDKLSTGTRIQLLLSVRLAFVETQEPAVKLPILADELLANSDDSRASAIIEALTEISKDGRQVFYFTAQADEAWKWKEYLSNSEDIDFKIYKLPLDSPSDELKYDVKPPESVDLITQVPKPEGKDHKAYGKTLKPDSYNLMKNKPSELHLWYLIEVVNLLYNCLKQGLIKYGQFESFLEHDGKIKGLERDKIFVLKEKVRLLEHYQDLLKQGHPNSIDRSVLEASGAVSDHFIEEVSRKLNDLNGNPELLLNALKNEVSGFRTNKIDKLENFFIEKGIIDEREQLNEDEIQSRTQAYVSNLEISAEEAEEFLGRIFGD